MDLSVPIIGFENYYISNDGFVTNTKSGRVLTPSTASKGYYIVALCNRVSIKKEYIHRLVGKYFVPNPSNKPFINHVDGNKQNNKAENLEWVTPKENIHHAYATGLCPTSIKALQGGILSEAQVHEIRELLRLKTPIKEIATSYNLNVASILNIYNKKTWSHI